MVHRVVFIGAGGRGRHWIDRVREHPSFEPVAVVDPAGAAHEAVATQFPDLTAERYHALDEAVAKVKADVAIVAAVSWYRREDCLAAIDAGWHILVEKPFALSLADATAIVEAGERGDRVVSVGQNYRYRPETSTMRRMIADGELGEIGYAVVSRHVKRYAAGTYQETMRHPYVWEMGIHDMDLLRFTLGQEPLTAAGVSFRPPWGDFEGENAISVAFEFEGNVRASYFGAWASHIHDLQWRVDGSDAALRLAVTEGIYTGGLEMATPEDPEWRPVEMPDMVSEDDRLLDELVEAIETGGETSTSGRDNLKTVAISEAIIRSTESGGQPVSIPELLAGD